MTLSALGTILIYLAVIIIFIVAAWYIIQQLELPPPILKFVMIAGVAVGAALIIWLLINLASGHGLSLSLLTGTQALWGLA